MAKKLLSDAEAKAIADKLIVLLTTTDIAKGGCNVCGEPGHVAGRHDQAPTDAAPNPPAANRG